MESLVWLLGPFAVALPAILVAQRRGVGWIWAVIAPPYIAVALYYLHADLVARQSGFQRIDGSAIDGAWNAGGVALLLGTVAHIAILRRWSVVRSVVVAGFVALVPALFGILGAGVVLGVVGSIAVVALHAVSKRLSAKIHRDPAS